MTNVRSTFSPLNLDRGLVSCNGVVMLSRERVLNKKGCATALQHVFARMEKDEDFYQFMICKMCSKEYRYVLHYTKSLPYPDLCMWTELIKCKTNHIKPNAHAAQQIQQVSKLTNSESSSLYFPRYPHMISIRKIVHLYPSLLWILISERVSEGFVRHPLGLLITHEIHEWRCNWMIEQWFPWYNCESRVF